MKKFGAYILLYITIMATMAYGVPLDLYTTYVAAHPSESKKGQWVQLMARGTGTNDMYVMEVDPTTGAIPVSGTIVVSNPSVGPTGDPVPSDANYIAGINPSGDLQGVAVETDGSLNVNIGNDTNYGTPGANTLRTAAMLGVGSTAVSNSNPVPISDAGGTITVDGTVTANQGGTWNITNISGTVSLPTGAATSALQTTGNTSLSSINTHTANIDTILNGDILTALQDIDTSTVDIDSNTSILANVTVGYGAPTTNGLRTAAMMGVGTAAVSNANPVPISDAGGSITVDGTVAATQSGNWSTRTQDGAGTAIGSNYGSAASALRVAAQIGNASAVADFGTGASSAQTLRVVNASDSPAPKGRSYADSSSLNYGSTSVTTGAWVQLIASSAATINALTIFSGCGETIELGTGAAASETRVALIPPGGLDGQISLTIASGTRISVRGVTGTCSSGYLALTGFN